MGLKHLCVITRNMKAGGAERVISHLLKYANTKNVKISLILIDKAEIQYDLSDKCQIYDIGKLGSKSLTDKYLRYKKVRKLVKKVNPDLVLSMPEDIGIYVILALLGTKYPVVISERNNPWVMPNKKISRVLRKLMYPFATGFIFQTKQAQSFFSRKIQSKGIVLPNPVDVSMLPAPYQGEREKIIVGAGRLEPQKNFSLLIDSFAEFYKSHSDYRLVIYGEGRLKEELMAHAKGKLPTTAFEFAGRVSDLPERLNKATAFVLSSDFEGMPNVLIEAMACGVPSISTDCPSGGSAELIEDGVNGILVPVGGREQLTNSLHLLVDKAETREKISCNAIKVRETLNAEVIVEKWFDYIKGTSKN